MAELLTPYQDITARVLDQLFGGFDPAAAVPSSIPLSPADVADAFNPIKHLPDGHIPETPQELRCSNNARAQDFIRNADPVVVWAIVRSAAALKLSNCLQSLPKLQEALAITEQDIASGKPDHCNLLGMFRNQVAGNEQAIEITRAHLRYIDEHAPFSLHSPTPFAALAHNRKMRATNPTA